MFRITSRWTAVLPLLLTAPAALAASNGQLSSGAKGVNTSSAPVPAPLVSGRRIFVSFDPGDVLAFPSVYSGGPERAYSEFYADMKQWGHYSIVLDPQQADLIFSIRFVEGAGLAWPQMRLAVSDARTHVILWGFVEQVDGAVFRKHRDQAFSNAVMMLVNDLSQLVVPGTPSPYPQGYGEKKPAKARLSDQY